MSGLVLNVKRLLVLTHYIKHLHGEGKKEVLEPQLNALKKNKKHTPNNVCAL